MNVVNQVRMNGDEIIDKKSLREYFKKFAS